MKRKMFETFIYRGTRIALFSGLSLTPLFTSCVKDQYDLSKGVDTEITVGGDSLLVPVGSSKPIRLDSMIKSNDIELLKKSSDGAYALHKSDSTQVDVKSINPVTFAISPITVNPSVVNFADLKFPTLVIDPVSSVSVFNTPSFLVDQQIPPVNVSTTVSTVLNVTLPSPIQSSATGQRRTKAAFTVGPFTAASGDKSFTQVIDIPSYPTELKKVDKVYLKNNTVNITIDQTSVNSLTWASKTSKVKNFRIDFPAEYHLINAKGPAGSSATIVGNSFVVTDDILPATNIVTYSFDLDYLNAENVAQDNKLQMTRVVPYNFTYEITGEVSQVSDVNGKTASLGLDINIAPSVKDLEIESNSVSLSVDAGNKPINNVFTGIPTEVSHISDVTFEDGAAILLSIIDPNISPFSLSDGYFEISMPKSFVFKPTAGLNTTTNVLTLPYSSLYIPKKLEVTKLNINQDVVDGSGSFKLNDNLSYKAVNLKMASIRTMLSTVQNLGEKSVNLKGEFSNFKVLDAAVTTKKITAVVPTKTSEISISKFVSNDVKKLYLANLSTPSILKLQLSVAGLPSAIDSLYFSNYKISFPTSLKFKAGTVSSKNEIFLNGGFKVSKGFLTTLQIEGFDFGTDGSTLTNGIFNLNESVSLSGSVFVKGTNLNVKDMGSITVSPTIEVGDMSIGYVEGLVSPTIDPVIKNITLNLPDFLKQNGTKLDIVNPVITMEISNTTGIPVDINMDLVPKRNGVIIPNASISTSMSIAAATKLGEPTWSKFWLAPKSEGVTNGYQLKQLANLPNLLKTVPDQIDIKVNPVVTGTRHKVDLKSLINQLKVKYNIHVPLDFGQDFEIMYTDTVADLKENITKVTKYANAIDMIAVIENTIPLDLNFEVIPLDASKHKIDGITIKQASTIKSCDINGNAQKSYIDLGLKETVPGDLNKLDAFSIKVSATKNSTVAGLPLNANQSVSIAFKVKIPNGITVTDK